ncbi:pantothenate kinase [Microbacteriaceae bacterium SG_E_30_P1]|uniref:Pantothenate kinase n=1 Tax=Antiquaquibacter oligotrophicus TaxID=2880260 RepID=A0ABT6KMG4_9MICO|nr:nucleoside/nucleotide kinase family protein [Antiquaquibacter oligotrophicus]MDH6181198.1 pantothenate kinase [Antiquaquibacter oligotrophicus]UDF13107.1 nucleoside/nucleotide kinase family protein [Antiquaquibacter oligotrophicus]
MSDPAVYPERELQALVDRLRSLHEAAGRRVTVGIAGSPGSGKTTLASALTSLLGASAAHLPMDGFHLANATLDRLGRRDRKGAIDTFDGWGFVALLERVRHETGNPIFAPSFERTVDEPVAGEIMIPPEAEIVVVEGNYLLVPEHPWLRGREAMDEAWFCSTDERERERRLVERHIRSGRSLDAAIAWARDVDGANARLIEPTRAYADLVVSGLTGDITHGL